MQILEIEIRGPVGSGKTEVMKVISDALVTYYGPHTQVASYDLSLEERSSSEGVIADAKCTGQRCRQEDTVFILRETPDGAFERDPRKKGDGHA